MTVDEIKIASLEDIEARHAEIKSLVESKDETADFEALGAELDAIEERKAELVEEARKADVEAVLAGAGDDVTENIITKENRTMADVTEIRKSSAYIDAFAQYIKNGDDTECRKLLTENVSGVVPVPVFVEDEIRTAWSDNKLLARVKKSYLKGNMKIGFEISADGAVIHTEGADAPSEEKLVIGIITLTAVSIKKWITISDEAYDLKGEAFLRYIYDELTYQIAKKAEDTLIAKIEACGTVSTNTPTTNVAVPLIANTGTLSVFAEALANLSDRASNPCIVMNKASYATFKALQYAANYPVDIFEGMEVLFNDTIASFEAATTGVTYAIVGDFGVGAQANFPNGEEINIKFDDLSLSEADLVKIVGREFVGLGVVAPNAFVKITKEIGE